MKQSRILAAVGACLTRGVDTFSGHIFVLPAGSENVLSAMLHGSFARNRWVFGDFPLMGSETRPEGSALTTDQAGEILKKLYPAVFADFQKFRGICERPGFAGPKAQVGAPGVK